ncbi:DUF5412 domain-containing protein [Peptostreptococcaceae bacterium OttesenSCG-928-C18]|nr:DUF5412 domain-containing protein [Peptostreptococcaceae bacterium OttesenSCG-928-C18]
MKKIMYYMYTIILLCVLTGCNNTQRLEPDELKNSVESPSGRYTVEIYQNNGKSLSQDAILGVLIDNETNTKKNIYWMYKEYNSDVKWIDEVTVEINGKKLNVIKDVYDCREDGKHNTE